MSLNLILPHELVQLERDLKDLIVGSGSSEIVFHWYEEDPLAPGRDEAYGSPIKKAYKTETNKGHVIEVSNHNVQVKPTQNGVAVDLEVADHVLLFETTVNTEREGLWFSIAGLGDFTPDAKPPLGVSKRTTPLIKNNRLYKEIYVRARYDGKNDNTA